ncbi:MAG: prolyl oligopeptidase family serine peptidase [Acidobacteria bacterium]|nr:prolyl oligopeptidase family serine peptidase [Acidobacteriota bacterium]
MSRRISTLAVACALLLWGRAALAEEVVCPVDGVARTAIVYARAAASAEGRVPVIFAFHGRGDVAQNFQFTLLHRAWPEAVVVYFQGLEDRGLAGWQVERGQNSDRDLKLVDAALAWARGKYAVDADRIYATGFSNGAMFTYLLWAERPTVFAAYAAVAGRLRPSVQPKQPRPLFHVAGAADEQVAFADQKAAIVTAVGVNGVRDSSAKCGDGCTIYGQETPNPVMAWIHPGGHVYPRDTSDRIVAFFKQHPRVVGTR